MKTNAACGVLLPSSVPSTDSAVGASRRRDKESNGEMPVARICSLEEERQQELLQNPQSRFLPRERPSDSSTTAAAGHQHEGEWPAVEADAKKAPQASLLTKAGIQEAEGKESADRKTASLAATNQRLQEALQRTREEIAVLEMLQKLQLEMQRLEATLTPKELAVHQDLQIHSPAVAHKTKFSPASQVEGRQQGEDKLDAATLQEEEHVKESRAEDEALHTGNSNQCRLKRARREAETAVAEAGAVLARVDQLQLEKLQQRQRKVERCAAANTFKSKAQLQAAELREKKLKQALADALQSLAFLSSLRREWPRTTGSPRHPSEFHSGCSLTLSANRLRLRSLSSSSSLRSGSPEFLQSQRESCDRNNLRETPLRDDHLAALQGPLRIPQWPDLPESSKILSASAAPDASTAACAKKISYEELDQQQATASFPEDLVSFASSNATAALIVQSQLLAEEQAKAHVLQQLVAAEPAEAAAVATANQMLSLLANNASLQAKLAGAAAVQRQQVEATQSDALLEALCQSEKGLRLRCQPLGKEKETWKEQMQQQLQKYRQLTEQLHQQGLPRLDAQPYSRGTARRLREQKALTLASCCCSPNAKERTNTAAAALSSADSDLLIDQEKNPSKCALQQLVKGLQQLEKDLEHHLKVTAHGIITRVCTTLLDLGLLFFEEVKEKEAKRKGENALMRGLLQSEVATRCLLHSENVLLKARLSALQTKLNLAFLCCTVLNALQRQHSRAAAAEALAAVESEQTAELHKEQVGVGEITKPLQCALATLKEWKRERPLLLSHQLASAKKVSELRSELR
ncbi:hypothetical protein Efla_005806 [Eimeria flavescens]